MNNDEILEKIDEFIESYDRLIHKAVNDDDVNKFYQYIGSRTALEILKHQIES